MRKKKIICYVFYSDGMHIIHMHDDWPQIIRTNSNTNFPFFPFKKVDHFSHAGSSGFQINLQFSK